MCYLNTLSLLLTSFKSNKIISSLTHDKEGLRIKNMLITLNGVVFLHEQKSFATSGSPSPGWMWSSGPYVLDHPLQATVIIHLMLSSLDTLLLASLLHCLAVINAWVM